MSKWTLEEKDKINAWLQNNWTHDKHCPLCYSTYWNVGGAVYELKEQSGDDCFPSRLSP